MAGAICALLAGTAALIADSPAAGADGGFKAAGPLPQPDAGRVWGVAVDPADPTRVLAATDAGVFISTDSASTWHPALTGVRAWTVGFDARNAQNAFAGTAGQGVFASGDGGATWTPASAGLKSMDVRSLAFGLDGIGAGTDAGVAESPDGRTWHDAGLDGVQVSSLAVAANSPQFTLVAGGDSGNLSAGSLFESSGGGWQPLQSGLPASMVVTSVTAGPIDAAVPKRPLVVTTSKGVFRSGDGGTTWTGSTGVPESLTLTTAAFDPLDPSVVYAGADAAGSTGGEMMRSTDGGQSFGVADAGLPSSKNVAAIGFAQTNPLTVLVAIDPPTGRGAVYVEVDSSLPAPPQLTPEAPGAAVPTVVATPTPSPTPRVAPAKPATPAASAPSGFQKFLEAVFHWPVPLVYEIIFVLLAAYIGVRWRQRYYVEGPP